MANRITGVSEKILQCAKKEFLEKGFVEASLRTIAANANTTPRSIYTRYSHKEGLFGALVSPALDALCSRYTEEYEGYYVRSSEEQRALPFDEDFAVHYDNLQREVVDHIYDNFHGFKLLVDCSAGTSYENFMEDFVKMDLGYTLKYIEATKSSILIDGRASKDLLEVLSRLQIRGMFEAVHREMDRESAHIYIKQLRNFFEQGWASLLTPETFSNPSEASNIENENIT